MRQQLVGALNKLAEVDKHAVQIMIEMAVPAIPEMQYRAGFPVIRRRVRGTDWQLTVLGLMAGSLSAMGLKPIEAVYDWSDKRQRWIIRGFA